MVASGAQCPQEKGKSGNGQTHIMRRSEFFWFVADPVLAPDKQHRDRAKVGHGRCVMGRTGRQVQAICIRFLDGFTQVGGQLVIAWLSDLSIGQIAFDC